MLPNLYIHLKKLPLTLNGKIHYDALPSIGQARRKQRQAPCPPRTPAEATLARASGARSSTSTRSASTTTSSASAAIRSSASRSSRGPTRRGCGSARGSSSSTRRSGAGQRRHRGPGSSRRTGGAAPRPHPAHANPALVLRAGAPEPDAWCILVPLEARQPLDVARLKQALTTLLHHHDALRLRVIRGPSGWEASVAPPGGTDAAGACQSRADPRRRAGDGGPADRPAAPAQAEPGHRPHGRRGLDGEPAPIVRPGS